MTVAIVMLGAGLSDGLVRRVMMHSPATVGEYPTIKGQEATDRHVIPVNFGIIELNLPSLAPARAAQARTLSAERKLSAPSLCDHHLQSPPLFVLPLHIRIRNPTHCWHWRHSVRYSNSLHPQTLATANMAQQPTPDITSILAALGKRAHFLIPLRSARLTSPCSSTESRRNPEQCDSATGSSEPAAAAGLSWPGPIATSERTATRRISPSAH